MEKENDFNNVTLYISNRIRRVLQFLPVDIKSKAQEIRLRANLPVCLTIAGETLFVREDSSVSHTPSRALVATYDELQESLLLLCKSSVYAHERELREGYISLPNGCRAGVSGAWGSEGQFCKVSSINIRIAREVLGCADALLSAYRRGMLIAGPPGSGKTTLLRDLVRQLSSGGGGYKRVAVIDSRGELSGGFDGASHNDLGPSTDVLHTESKAAGTQIALRTMFPDIIAFDEVGTKAELRGIADSFNAGVDIITSAHCGSVEELLNRSVTKELINSGAVSDVAVLSAVIGKPPEILDVRKILCECSS